MNLCAKRKTLSLIFFIGSLFTISGCSSYKSTGFDGKSYDISANNDESLLANVDKISGGYKITLSGNGISKDFTKESKVPWYSILPKIKEVEIKEGVEGLGNNIFTGIKLDYFYLPSTLTSVSESSFDTGKTLYSYAEVLNGAENYDVYYFSENAPIDSNKSYWHLVNGMPTTWVVASLNALFVGNSFTYYNDMPILAQNIAQNLGYKLTCDSVTVGSHTLEQYADTNDEYGKILDDKLNSSTIYNYVILQEQSSRSYAHYDSFESSVGNLVNKIHQAQTSASISLYETWGYEEEATNNKWTIPEMEQQICSCYDKVAEKYDLSVHYVGKAFTEVYNNHSEINLYNEQDNKHPSYAGSYLSALVHIGTMFKCDVRTCTFNGTLDETTANTLKEVAFNVVF